MVACCRFTNCVCCHGKKDDDHAELVAALSFYDSWALDKSALHNSLIRHSRNRGHAQTLTKFTGARLSCRPGSPNLLTVFFAWPLCVFHCVWRTSFFTKFPFVLRHACCVCFQSTLVQPQMMVVSDIQDMFLPLLDGFLVDVDESKALIER